MIKKITKNKDNLGEPELHPIEKIEEKFDYYRESFAKLSSFNQDEIDELKADITSFFTLKSVRLVPEEMLPKQLVRISNNNGVLKNQNKPLGLLTDIDQILAPPKKNCWYNRCSLPEERVIYCATDLITAYWETRPKKGDVITIAVYELKEDAKYNCSIISKEKKSEKKNTSDLGKVFDLIEDFFIEIYTRKVTRTNAQEYLFSAVISSNQLFYPIASKINIEAIIFPSVQRELNGHNIAIKNDLILDYYHLKGVKTAFVTKELLNVNPKEDIQITENILFEPTTIDIDIAKGRINHKAELIQKFDLLREMQLDIIANPETEVRFENPIDFKIIQNLIITNRQKIKELNPKDNTMITIKHLGNNKVETVEYKKARMNILGGTCEILTTANNE